MRAEGTSWRVREDMAGTCSLCRGIIPAGEPFRAGKQAGATTGEVCLTCIATAVSGILPGNPRQVVVELDPEQPGDVPAARYLVEADGDELGTATVDLFLRRTGKEPEALLTLVCNALARRAVLREHPPARYSEAGDGWCSGEPPQDQWLVAWVRGPKSEPDRDDGDGGAEYWTPAIFTVPDQGLMFLGAGPGERTWCFTYKVEPQAGLEVLAWRPGPERPRALMVDKICSMRHDRNV